MSNKGNFADVANGGMYIFDVSTSEPTLLSQWDTAYVHDMWVEECQGKKILFAAAIFDDFVYMIDISDPSNPVDLVSWHARQGAAHNVPFCFQIH